MSSLGSIGRIVVPRGVRRPEVARSFPGGWHPPTRMVWQKLVLALGSEPIITS